MYKVIYSQQARLDLRSLEYIVAQRIIRKIAFYGSQDNPLSFAKRLSETGLGHFRFRIGDYRALFDIDKSGMIHILMILRIKHRKDIYDL